MREFRGTAAPRLVLLLWALAAIALGLFAAVRPNPNASLLLIAAGLLGGAGVVWALTLVIQAVNGASVGAWGSEREMLVLALLLLSLAVPWRPEIQVARAGAIFGWATPLAWLTVVGLVPTLTRRLGRFEGPGLALSGAALVAWFAWISWLPSSPAFQPLGFPFRPVDMLDYGWYLAVAAWAIAAEGAASRAAWEQEGPVSSRALLAWALVPGMGLVRLQHRGAGRLWLLGSAAAMFFLHGTGYTPAQFAYSASNAGQLPQPTPRGDFTVFAALVVVVWLASIGVTLRARRAS